MAKKEFKIGEVFQCGLVKLKCEKATIDCTNCFFEGVDYCCTSINEMTGSCDSSEREDKTNVVFVKVED